MLRTGMHSKKCLLLLALPLLAFVAGCPLPATAVLEGTWAFTVDSTPNLNELLLTFNQNGQVTNVTYQVTGSAEISVNAPVGQATVNGKNVSVTSTFQGNSLTFNGTLNDDNTVAQGTITLQITVGAVTVTVNGGAATMTKLLQ